MWAGIACAATGLAPTRAAAEALLVIEAESGKVLYAQNAGYPWYPASVTKLMTAYVTLRAVDEGRITLDKPLTVSANAAAQNPVKMGFPAGTQVTVDNALKMLMVKSANDMAVVLAEGVAGSVENFADQMNATAQRLGMVQSSFVNPNGLPADDQISSARDLAILARALIREMPEYDYYWNLPGIRMGKMVQRNYNTLLGRYPGADGMKTGFICASGFNLVASATRDGKRLIAVVLGAPSSAARAMKAAQLLERGFNSSSGLSWLMPTAGTVESLQPDRCHAAESARPDVRAVTASARLPRMRTISSPATAGPIRPMRCSCRACEGARPRPRRARRSCRTSRWANRSWSLPGPSHRRRGRRLHREEKDCSPPSRRPPRIRRMPPPRHPVEAAAPKPKPKPPAPKDTAKVGAPATAAVAAPGDAVASKPKPKPAAPASTVAATPTGDAAAPKPKPKPRCDGRCHACVRRRRAQAEAQAAGAQGRSHIPHPGRPTDPAVLAGEMTAAGATRSQDPVEPIPLTVLTGFLGAGKTSLLSRLVTDPALAETAVIINEFGEIGLDHLLVRPISDGVVLLQSGCLCCTLRGDLVDALEQLLRDLDNGRAVFRRVILETTGLADPAPVLQTAMAHPYLVMRYRLDGVITVVDAVNGARRSTSTWSW